eukprot:scaffold8334_cov59-Phaeocystis_antarctica.AAC.5
MEDSERTKLCSGVSTSRVGGWGAATCAAVSHCSERARKRSSRRAVYTEASCSTLSGTSWLKRLSSAANSAAADPSADAADAASSATGSALTMHLASIWASAGASASFTGPRAARPLSQSAERHPEPTVPAPGGRRGEGTTTPTVLLDGVERGERRHALVVHGVVVAAGCLLHRLHRSERLVESHLGLRTHLLGLAALGHRLEDVERAAQPAHLRAVLEGLGVLRGGVHLRPRPEGLLVPLEQVWPHLLGLRAALEARVGHEPRRGARVKRGHLVREGNVVKGCSVVRGWV